MRNNAQDRHQANRYAVHHLVLLMLLSGCTAHYPINHKILRVEPRSGYSIDNPAPTTRSDSLLVMLAFSGGGTRAAAFAYGVLEKLAHSYITWDGKRRRLLDEVDMISSVSGGSFTATYYGLFGERIFTEFEQKFLNKDVQGALRARLLSPASWPRLWSSVYHRSELAAAYYDEILFEGRTIGDIQARDGPFIIINATEISLGGQFGFEQRQFDLLCSDAARFPVSRAVAASSAVPILFSPITLQNFAGSCAHTLPEWATQALDKGDVSAREYQPASRARALLDREKMPFIHLLDGGLSDNLGIRPILDLVSISGGAWNALKALGRPYTRRVVVIVVNAQTATGHEEIGRRERVPFTYSLQSATSVPLNSYSFETLSLIRDLMNTWDEDITIGRCWELAKQGLDQTGCYDMDHFLIEVSFDQIPDEARRERLKRLPTSFQLPVESVDELRRTAAGILEQSADFKHMLRDQIRAPARSIPSPPTR
ncbi:MAG: patatin-like phospholipase family protein [Gammaproteobacteria bacterium]